MLFRSLLIKMKYDIPNDKLEMFDEYKREIELNLAKVYIPEGAEDQNAPADPAGQN